MSQIFYWIDNFVFGDNYFVSFIISINLIIPKCY